MNCDEYSGDKLANMFDMSSIRLIPESDTLTFLNGTLKFLKDMNMKWGVRVYTEHRVQGSWVIQAFDRKYIDMCESMKNALEPFHPYVKDKKPCPLKAGVSLFVF
jgi:hypothetical protein